MDTSTKIVHTDPMKQLMQELLDKVVTGMCKQGKPSTNKGGTCRYRSGELKCSIGMLISDEYYTEDMEGSSVVGKSSVFNGVKQSFPEIAKYDSNRMKQFLNTIQRAHDMNTMYDHFTGNFLREMKSVTEEFGLNMPELG